MAHWQNRKNMGRVCVTKSNKLTKSANCKGGKGKKGKKAAKATKKCHTSYHHRAYKVAAGRRKCPRK
jgi:hypothetical protein